MNRARAMNRANEARSARDANPATAASENSTELPLVSERPSKG